MKIRALLLVSSLLTAACQVPGSSGGPRSIRYLVAQGEYKLAVETARAAWEAAPDDERAQADYRHASVALLLERGRRYTFDDQDELALADFEAAAALQPDAEQPAAWAEKTRLKLSWKWYLTARDNHTADDLLAAADAYEQALDYDKDNLDALAGLYRVGVQLAYRDGLSVDYYNEGLAALREHSLHVAGSRFDYARKYRDGDDKPAKRRAEVDTKLSAEFAARGADLESRGYYAAAKNEFRIAIGLDETNQAAQDGFERMLLEAEVHEEFKAGEMWIRRGEWDKAVAVLEAGLERTAVQQDRFIELMGTIDDLRTRAAYEQAMNLEHDFRYVEAARAYQALIDERGFFEDARARLTRLEQVIGEVDALYGTLESIEDPAQLLETLQKIDVLWPEYRDVQERLEALGG